MQGTGGDGSGGQGTGVRGTGGDGGGVQGTGRQDTSGDGKGVRGAGSGREERPSDGNPFAPPAEGTPDRPWQPRRPSGQDSSGDGQGAGDGQDAGEGGGRPPWGSQWSDRQPGRASGGFGERPRRPEPGAEQPGGGRGPGLRWDPTDPAQRRARYALLSGMWAFFFALFGWPYVALLLGAPALYWGVSALRAKPREPEGAARPGPAPEGRPQSTAAISGLVTACLALALVASGFAAQLVYRDYYTCVNDALTNQAKHSCDSHLPQHLRGILGVDGG
ncbi:hypothetical protein [Streptomyces sp. NPDC046985]|uniref:hypothetical protein n=1 Tax=Streptomyces sp. NPDC046985 TaxID=3155377 RepID=UPI0033D99330